MSQPDIPGPSLLSSATQQNSAKSSISSLANQHMTAKPNYDPFASISVSHPSSRSTTPVPQSLQSLQNQKPKDPPQPSSDPFAILSSPAPQQSAPFSDQQNLPSSAPSSIFNFGTSAQPPKSPNPQPETQQSNGASNDDDWNFTSALPDDSTNLPTSNELTVSKTSVTICFKLSRPDSNGSVVNILASFSNNTESLITEYTFQVAIAKVCMFRRCWMFGANTRVLEFHASTNPSVRTNPTTTARKRDHTAHGNPRCGIETGEFRQDAMEGVVQGCWRSAAGRRRGSGLGHSLRIV